MKFTGHSFTSPIAALVLSLKEMAMVFSMGTRPDDPAEKQEKINQDIGKLKFLFLHTSPPKTHDNPQIYPPAYRTPPAGQSLSGI